MKRNDKNTNKNASKFGELPECMCPAFAVEYNFHFSVPAGPQPDRPLMHYTKRPSYSRMVRSKVNEMRPIDARGKARRLQRISLRRRK